MPFSSPYQVCQQLSRFEEEVGDVQPTEIVTQPAQYAGLPYPKGRDASLSGYTAHPLLEEIQAAAARRDQSDRRIFERKSFGLLTASPPHPRIGVPDMNPFWPFLTLPAAPQQFDRRTRLQDLDARMASFLKEKQISNAACPEVLNNISTARTKVQREIIAND